MALYGRTGTITAQPGQRDALAAILAGMNEGASASQTMPGCILYVVGVSPEGGEAVHITEVWDSAEAHAASLDLPQVQAAIARARPLIAGMEGAPLTILSTGLSR